MRYYIQAFNTMLTTNLENNGFLTGASPPFLCYSRFPVHLTIYSVASDGLRRQDTVGYAGRLGVIPLVLM